MEEVLGATYAAMGPEQRMLIEYKPFEPAFYHTDIADWGMAMELARGLGPKAKVLVDTGHHFLGTNVEQIVAGCCIWECWVVFTSTIVSMPMTI
jgi:L-rhamnose isomerase / sugar isomerase